ncbi:MAG: DUF3307 domain-containing protein [Mangrovicoccus sp.]|nr:DUF3307 domain-containing protein [Mangrovicoccus sp.]
MIETFTALLLAHVLADFLFQTGAMIAAKHRLSGLAQHIMIVVLTAWIITGADPRAPETLLALAALAGLHFSTDFIKMRVGDQLGPFLADQAAHLLALVILAAYAPALWQAGLWPTILPPELAALAPAAMAITAGGLVSVRAGGFAIAKLMTPYQANWDNDKILQPQTSGLEGASQRIGELERGLAYLLIIAGHPTGVAFLIAAKSILRFNASSNDRRIAEYVIIGTLASMGWAMVTGFAISHLLGALH